MLSGLSSTSEKRMCCTSAPVAKEGASVVGQWQPQAALQACPMGCPPRPAAGVSLRLSWYLFVRQFLGYFMF